MNKEIQIFKNEKFGEIRIAEINGEPLFCLPDLCNVLGLTNPSSVKSRLDEGDVQLIDLHALNSVEGVGNQTINFVNESGFYDVLFQSNSPKVKPFRKWVTSEVLPSIRKTGSYSVQPISTLDIFKLTLKCIEEQGQELQEVRKEVSQIRDEIKIVDAKTTNRPDYFSVVGYCALRGIKINLSQARIVGMRATRLSNEMGYPVDKMPDPRFGMINLYSKVVLNTLFTPAVIVNQV